MAARPGRYQDHQVTVPCICDFELLINLIEAILVSLVRHDQALECQSNIIVPNPGIVGRRIANLRLRRPQRSVSRVVAGLSDSASRLVKECGRRHVVICALAPSRVSHRQKHQEAERIQLA